MSNHRRRRPRRSKRTYLPFLLWLMGVGLVGYATIQSQNDAAAGVGLALIVAGTVAWLLGRIS